MTAALALLLAFTKPDYGFACPQSLAARVGALDAELSRRFGQKLVAECSCGNESCREVRLGWRLPVASVPGLKLTASWSYSLPNDPTKDVVHPGLTAEALKALAERVVTHSTVQRAIVGQKEARCELHPLGRSVCGSDRWSVELEDVKGQLDHGYFRLPLTVVEDDAHVLAARKDAGLAKFLADPGDVSVDFAPVRPDRLIFRRAAATFTVFVSTTNVIQACEGAHPKGCDGGSW